MGEKFSPDLEAELSKRRAKSDVLKEEMGAEVKDGRLEFTKEQVEDAKYEPMKKDERSELTPQELDNLKTELEGLKKKEHDLMVEMEKLSKELLPVWNGLRELEHELPPNIGMSLAKINGKYYFNGPEGDLAALEEKRQLLAKMEEVSPDQSGKVNEYTRLLEDKRQDEYINLKLEQKKVRDRLEDVDIQVFTEKTIQSES